MTASLDVISMGTYSHPAVRRDMESEIRGKKEVEVSSRGKTSSLGLAIPGWPRHPHLPFNIQDIFVPRRPTKELTSSAWTSAKHRSFQRGLAFFGVQDIESQRPEDCPTQMCDPPRCYYSQQLPTFFNDISTHQEYFFCDLCLS